MGLPLRAALLAALLLTTALSGCFAFLNPPKPPRSVDARLGPEVLVAENLTYAVGSSYLEVRIVGSPLVLPVFLDGVEAAAVYVDANLSYRADAVLKTFLRSERGPLYLQAPEGEWADVRATQRLRPAGPADLAARGFPDIASLNRTAIVKLPENPVPPHPTNWILNATFSAIVNRTDAVLAEPGLTVLRNATSVTVTEGHMVITYSPQNRSLNAAQVQDRVIFHVEAPALQADWNGTHFTGRIVSAPFRREVVEAEERPGLWSYKVYDARVVALTQSLNRTIEDDRLELWAGRMRLLVTTA